jgi:hypothetical protein
MVAVEVVDRLAERGRDGLPVRPAQRHAPSQKLDDRLGATGPLRLEMMRSHVLGSPRPRRSRHP